MIGQILKVRCILAFHCGSSVNENDLLEILKAVTKMAFKKLIQVLSSPHSIQHVH